MSQEHLITLPFSKKFQAGLLVQIIKDWEFCRNVIDDFSPSYLDAGAAHIKLLKIIKGLHSQYKRPLTTDIVRNSIIQLEQSQVLTEPEAAGIRGIIDLGIGLVPAEQAFIKDKAYDFLKKQDIKDIIHYNLTRIRTLKEEVASIQETNTITYEE